MSNIFWSSPSKNVITDSEVTFVNVHKHYVIVPNNLNNNHFITIIYIPHRSSII